MEEDYLRELIMLRKEILQLLLVSMHLEDLLQLIKKFIKVEGCTPIPDPKDLKVIKQNTISQAKTIRKKLLYVQNVIGLAMERKPMQNVHIVIQLSRGM